MTRVFNIFNKPVTPIRQQQLDLFLMHFQTLLMRYPMNQTCFTNGMGLYEAKLAELEPLAKDLTSSDLAKDIAEADVLIIGEDHGRNAARAFLIEQLPKLKEAGYTHLAVELIAIDERPLLKAFEQKAPGADSALKDFLADPNKTGIMATYVDDYMTLLTTAHDLGFRLEPITHPQLLEPWHEQARFSPAIFHDFMDIRFRDIFMCLAIENIKHRLPNAKIAALVGLGHSDANSGMPQILQEEFGQRTLSIAVCQREDANQPLLIKADKESLSRIPAYQTLNWRIDDRYPVPGHWILFAPPAK